MKYKLLIIISILAFNLTKAQNLKWSDNTADVLEQGRREIGIFAPFKMGLKKSSEISVHPLLFFVIPNLSIKKQWKANEKFRFASLHKFTYPTFLYNIISKNGVGGILPDNSKIPQMFKFNNAALISTNKFKQTFTLSLGLDLSLNFGESDFTYIEWDVVYPRTYALNNTFTPYGGINVTGVLYKNFIYDYKFKTFLLTKSYKGYITENTLKVIWRKSDKFAVKAGALFNYGDYPFGKDKGLFAIFDLMFGFKK